MNRSLIVSVMVFSLLSIHGCLAAAEEDTYVVSCVLEDGQRCSETEGEVAQTQAVISTCPASGGDFSDSACERNGIVFGCSYPDSGVTEYFYSPLTAADAENTCAEIGGTVIEAP
jgi:hypothetical protein